MTRLQPRCRRTGKRRYRDLIAANLALATIQARDSARRPKMELRAYACRACGGAHLTSMPKRPVPRPLRSSEPKPRPARKRTGPTAAVVSLVRERDCWRCVRCGVDVRTSPFGGSTQHRVARGAGGTSRAAINLPSNLLTLCGDGTRGCHGWVEAHPREAQALGLAVSHYIDPATVAVHYPGGWWLLTDDGSRHPHRQERSA